MNSTAIKEALEAKEVEMSDKLYNLLAFAPTHDCITVEQDNAINVGLTWVQNELVVIRKKLRELQ